MDAYDFDHITSRFNTYSAKWNHDNQTIIPLSVADMDIAVPNFMIRKLVEAAQKGIYGYTLLSQDWNTVTAYWFMHHYHWQVEPEHIVFCPRVIQAVSLYIQNYTQPNDRITILSPSYHPISQTVVANQRQLLTSSLIYSNQRYHIDFNDLEEKFRQSVCFILVSPHNPTGTVWSKNDLQKIAELAEKYQVFILSDDVHADFIFNDETHCVISTLSHYVAQHSFICTSPSKTFNIAGLEVANIVIANEQHRYKFKQCLIAAGIHNPNYFSVPAYLAAYTRGDHWLLALKKYLAKNRQWVIQTCQQYFPLWYITQSDGTYMLWINYQKMNISEQQLKHWFTDLAKIEMSWGSSFGIGGDGFFRINIATPCTRLQEVFKRLISTFPFHSQE